MLVPLSSLLAFVAVSLVAVSSLLKADEKDCLATAFPQNRTGFPALLNCLSLHAEAVEVGVQAGVHASSFLEGWQGKRLRLVDTWSPPSGAGKQQLFYVDIANVQGDGSAGKQHRAQCEARLAEPLSKGRAAIVNLDSIAASKTIPDGELDFLYLDARHDFAGVVADIHAWWPKVKVGGVFAGHDFVDGEFPEGDFFWVSALRAVLPGVEGHTHVTHEKDRYPSFFVIKSDTLAGIAMQAVDVHKETNKLYGENSRYFKLWQERSQDAGGFLSSCRDTCAEDCQRRGQGFTPTRTAGSTLRPFECGTASAKATGVSLSQDSQEVPDACASDMVVDVQAYLKVCLERCSVTCQQRGELFSHFGADMMSV